MKPYVKPCFCEHENGSSQLELCFWRIPKLEKTLQNRAQTSDMFSLAPFRPTKMSQQIIQLRLLKTLNVGGCNLNLYETVLMIKLNGSQKQWNHHGFQKIPDVFSQRKNMKKTLPLGPPTPPLASIPRKWIRCEVPGKWTTGGGTGWFSI